jgi:hypothetical protein
LCAEGKAVVAEREKVENSQWRALDSRPSTGGDFNFYI